MAQTRVTVGIVVRNDIAGARRVISSVLGQTWRGDLRVVVVDDASTDDSPAVLRNLAARHDNVELVCHDDQGGWPAAWQAVLTSAGDGYVAWASTRSVWTPRKLEWQLAALSEREAESLGVAVVATAPVRRVVPDLSSHTVRSPKNHAAQQQLLGEVMSSPGPSLSALVARADVFRSAPIDPALPTRYAYDFLVRFIAGGGQLVSPAAKAPLLTVIEPARNLAAEGASIKLLQQKHAPYLKQVRAEVRRRVRRTQLLQLAELDKRRGRRTRQALRVGRAALADPAEVLSALRTGIRPRRVSRAVSRGTAKGVAKLAPTLRQLGLIDLARKAGVLRTLRSSATGIVDDIRAQAERATSTAEVAAAEDELRAALSDATSRDANTWLHLEQRGRETGLLHSAELSVRRGISEHPRDSRLRVRLIELLALRKKSAEAVAEWDGFDAKDDVAAGITYARIARALRELGKPARSLAVAEGGLAKFPHERRLRDEAYISRAGSIDWRSALVPDDTRGVSAVGEVTSLGFLAGDDEPLAGAIRADREPATVGVAVNGIVVATTSAALVLKSDESNSEVRTFTLRCDDVLRFVGDGDAITIESAGSVLAGGAFRVATGYESRAAELQAKVAAGSIFTKFGTLRTGHTDATKTALLTLYDDISAVLSDLFGYDAYPSYGNLLGAIREHDFIAHDVGGFDMDYVSRHSTSAEVKGEFLAVCRELAKRGYFLRIEPWSAYVRHGYRSREHVDLNFAWFDENNELHLSAGSRDVRAKGRNEVLAARTSLMHGRVVTVPGEAEAVLRQIYGPTWAVPNQGFKLNDGLVVDDEFLLTAAEMLELERSDPDRVQAKIEPLESVQEMNSSSGYKS